MKRSLFPVFILAFSLVFCTASLWALKNICGKCRTKAELTDVVCKKCETPLNKCLECGKENMVKADFCTQCGEALAEMRVLSSIDEELREELRLGKSDRAQLDQELTKLQFQLSKFPDKEGIILYRIAKIYKNMHFFAREAQTWEDFLKKFPDDPKKNRIRAFLSEATRQWGYLFYQQRQIPQALEKFTRAARINPLNSEAWMWVARVQSEKKQYQASGDAYINALKAQPGNKIALNFLRGLKRVVPEELRKSGPPIIDMEPLAIPPYPQLPPQSAVEPAAPQTPKPPVPAPIPTDTLDPDAPATD